MNVLVSGSSICLVLLSSVCVHCAPVKTSEDILYPYDVDNIRMHGASLKCLTRNKVLWARGGGCWFLHENGPCAWAADNYEEGQKEWLVLREGQSAIAECQPRGCPEGQFAWKGECTEDDDLCPGSSRLTADPWGHTVCSCPHNYLWEGSEGMCHKMRLAMENNLTSPCPPDQDWLEHPSQPFLYVSREDSLGLPDLLLLQGNCSLLENRNVFTSPQFQCEVKDPSGGCRRPVSLRWTGTDSNQSLDKLFSTIRQRNLR